MNSPDEHSTVQETLRWLASRIAYPWSVWRRDRTKRWWAVPLWPSAPPTVIHAGHHHELEAGMRELEQHHAG